MLKGVFREFLNLLFPPVCLLCDSGLVRSEKHWCTNCLAALPYIRLDNGRSQLLHQKLSATLPIKEILAYLLYQKSGSTQKLLQLLKYKNYPEIGTELGLHFGARLAKEGHADLYDLIIPVPLHSRKFKQRGYNQSELFAHGLSQALDIQLCTGVLVRLKESATQTRKSRLDRWLNVSTIFTVLDADQIKGKRILLTDDVITTGATIEACGEALVAGGCASLTVGVIAIA